MDTSPEQIAALVRQLLDFDSLPPIVQAGHPALRQPAVAFDGQIPDTELQALVTLMRQVMHAAPGVGLAAPQLGIPLQLAVLEDQHELPENLTQVRQREPLEFFAILNPSYTSIGSDVASFYEGCLSVTGWQAVVHRAAAVQLTYLDVSGVAQQRGFTGWQARIVQHETDHLSGTIYLDKAVTRSLSSNAEYERHWAQPTIDKAQRELGF